MVEINLMIGIGMSLKKYMGIEIDTSIMKEGMSQLDSILN